MYHRRIPGWTILITAITVLVVVVGAMLAVQHWEAKTAVTVLDAGQQVTAITSTAEGAQVYMNRRWYAPRNLETMLIIGIDELGAMAETNAYNNRNQADFLALYARDVDTGRSFVLHLNRDTMTDITVLGVTGENAGTRRAQLALSYNYGSGGSVSSRNTASAVEHLLYGVGVDHYLTVTMNAIPLLNDWAGGVELEVKDDFSAMDASMAKGQTVTLMGNQALTYVRTRYGMDDSSNLHRMTRQRQYAAAWLDAARAKLNDQTAVAELVMQLKDYHHSDCTAEELAAFARKLGEMETIPIYEIPGEARLGETYVEYYADEEALQQLVLECFYTPIGV